MCSLSSRPCRCSPWCWKCRSVSLAAFQGDWHGFKREDGLNLTRIQIWTQRICSNFSSLSPQHICFASSSDCIFFLNTSAPAGDWVWHQNLRKWFNITLSIPLTWPHTCLHTYTHILTHSAAIQTPLHLSTFIPDQPPMSCLWYCTPAWRSDLSFRQTPMYTCESGKSDTGLPRQCDYWVDRQCVSVCVECDRRLWLVTQKYKSEGCRQIY